MRDRRIERNPLYRRGVVKSVAVRREIIKMPREKGTTAKEIKERVKEQMSY